MADDQDQENPTPNTPSLPPADETHSYKFSENSQHNSLYGVTNSGSSGNQTPKLPPADETKPYQNGI